MTREELQKKIEDTCYGCDGRIDFEMVKHTIATQGGSLTPAERWACCGQLVYRPDKDVRSAHRAKQEEEIRGKMEGLLK